MSGGKEIFLSFSCFSVISVSSVVKKGSSDTEALGRRGRHPSKICEDSGGLIGQRTIT